MMTILTASTPGVHLQLTEVQRQSCLLCGILPERHLSLPIDPKYPRPYSWFKVRALLDHLHYHEHILWMDADAMMLKPIQLDFVLKSLAMEEFNHPVALAQDVNGWNCGVMLWRRCPEAFEHLWRIYDAFDKFREHPWFEQGAFHTMAEAINPAVLPKALFNAYPKDRTEESCILHLPATPDSARLAIMTKELEKLKARKP
jgi:hypothetical protein